MDHTAVLESLCRVCGRLLFTKSWKTRYPCKDFLNQLHTVFDILAGSDDPNIHPTHICHACKGVMKKTKLGYHHRTVVFEGWCAHAEDEGNCTVCKHYKALKQPGRPKKTIRTPGRPPTISSQHCIEWVKDVAPDSLVLPDTPINVCGVHLHLPLSELNCPICCDILNQPVELVTCGRMVCAECMCRWLDQHNSLSCPCCYTDHLEDFNTIKKAPSLVVTSISRLCVVCGNCDNHMKLDTWKDHHCTSTSPEVLPNTSVEDVLHQPISAPLTPIEQKLQTSLARRSMTDEHVLQLKTGGKPLTFFQVRQAQIPTGEAAPRTVRQRSQSLANVRLAMTAGDTTTQLAHELLSTEREDREKLLEDIKNADGNFLIRVPVQSSLAMKADLNFPWNKLRELRRWLSMWGLGLASEGKMRKEATKLVGKNLDAEIVPFAFPHKDGGQVIKNAPYAFIPNLWDKVKDLLDQNSDDHRGVHRVTWHKGVIPEDEVWLKLGGDKGGGTFKMCFQHVNITNPNAPENTCVFAIFEAPDSYTNLKIALGRYMDEINDLQKRTWRGKKVRIFLCGDYEFLCTIFGLTGATGRHCCLWCLIIQKELKIPPAIRGPVRARTTDCMCADHKKFSDGGSVRVKEYNNCQYEPFFTNFPLSQVCPPGLHISLGIFLRLFVLLEADCHKLDMTMRIQGGSGGPSFDRYSSALEEQTELKDKQKSLKDGLLLLQQLLTHTLSTAGVSSATNPLILEIVSEIQKTQRKLQDIQNHLNRLSETLKSGFHTEEGPFVKALDKALASFHVERQAYYSGSFVGNHVHQALKPKNLETLCHSVVEIAQSHCPAALAQALEIEKKHKKVLTLFHECHELYDQKYIKDEEIDELEKKIKKFMTCYRESFPTATVLPKMHFLEEHVIPWLRMWHVGFGMMGEQGIESIHKYFNSLKRTYCSIPDPVKRLQHTVQEHLLHIAPANIDAKPLVKKRKLSKDTTP